MAMSMMLRCGPVPAKLAGSSPMPTQSQRCATIVRAEGDKSSKSEVKAPEKDDQKAVAKVQSIRGVLAISLALLPANIAALRMK